MTKNKEIYMLHDDRNNPDAKRTKENLEAGAKEAREWAKTDEAKQILVSCMKVK